MYLKRDKKEIKINGKDEVIEKLFKSLLNKYQNNLEKSIRSSDFILNCGHLLYYKWHKVNLNRGE